MAEIGRHFEGAAAEQQERQDHKAGKAPAADHGHGVVGT
jgi:hypothetical protein